jgi:hypothetical protein
MRIVGHVGEDAPSLYCISIVAIVQVVVTLLPVTVPQEDTFQDEPIRIG